MGFLHSSRARGRVPGVLRAAADVRFVRHEGEGDAATRLYFVVPTFGEAAHELFEQRRLWDDGPKQEQTAFELFGSALNDVAARRTDSNRFDPGLLRRISRYRRVLKRGIEWIDLPDVQLEESPRLDATVVRAASELEAITPSARRVRIVGRLDVMGASQGVLKLDVRPGQIVTALWDGPEPLESLRDHFNRDVVLEGVAVFRPSGALLRVDADAIAAASPADDFFRTLPRGVPARDYRRLARLKPGEPSAYAQILGSIPAEEPDEDFAAAIDALS